MLYTVVVIGVGLILVFLGVLIAFKYEPPVADIPEKYPPDMITNEPAPEGRVELSDAALGKAVREKTIKFKYSKRGRTMLLAGAGIQLIGVIWQVFILACKR